MKLSPITKTQKEPEFAVLDIETMNWTEFIVLGYVDANEYHEFKSLKKFFKFLEVHDGPLNIYAHFGGKFDFMFLLDEILKSKTYDATVLVPRGSSILYFQVKIGAREYTFRDSSALLPFSLKSITENFGVSHMKQEWDHSKTKGYSKELSVYLQHDCKGLYESLKMFWSWPLIQKAGPSSTIAGQAMRVFRTYLKEELWGLGDRAADFCRLSYLGGRVEIFRPACTKGPLYEYDVNSLYPYVMRDNVYPVGNGHFTYDFVTDLLGIYEANVVAPALLDVPSLGIISDGKFLFPVGRFKGVWTNVELEYAKTLGYRIEVVKGYVFPQSRKLFYDFITDLYEIRLTSPKNSVSDIAAKLLMNSSYGRFGMSLDKENLVFGSNDSEGMDEYKTLTIGGRHVAISKEPVRLRTFTHPAIASFVTSYARIHMHKIFRNLGTDLYYTDTDSIFTTRVLDHGKDLGQLKLEATYESAIFLLPKTYIAKGFAKSKIAMKGFDKKKISQFEFDDFHNALEGDLKRFKIENEPKFATFKTALAQKKLVTMTKKSEKQLKAQYTKRTIFKVKGEFFTKPITLGETKCEPIRRPKQKESSKRPQPK